MTTTAELEREGKDLKAMVANGERLYALHPQAVDMKRLESRMERYEAIQLELHTRAGK